MKENRIHNTNGLGLNAIPREQYIEGIIKSY